MLVAFANLQQAFNPISSSMRGTCCILLQLTNMVSYIKQLLSHDPTHGSFHMSLCYEAEYVPGQQASTFKYCFFLQQSCFLGLENSVSKITTR